MVIWIQLFHQIPCNGPGHVGGGRPAERDRRRRPHGGAVRPRVRGAGGGVRERVRRRARRTQRMLGDCIPHAKVGT